MVPIDRTESKAEKDRTKQIQDRCQTLLTQMLRDEDNKYCVDCDAKGPRWASWNLGVFLCIRCAGIHRNLGVHISKVKSVNLDTWTPEQVVNLQQMGNSRARAVYEATIPDSWRRPQTDSSLEAFIRAKYQQKRYIAKEWVPPPIPKVDWNKELDEEADKQRRRRREGHVSALPPMRKLITDTNVPALPKPTSSPKASRASVVANDVKRSAAVDLLGLSTSITPPPTNSNGSDDAFSNFLSCPSEPVAPTTTVTSSALSDLIDTKGRTAEEDSFFNQPTPVIETKKTMSKDSILALYSSQNSAQPQHNMFAAPGMFPANPMQFAPTNQSFPNGMNPVITHHQPNVPPGANPFFGMSMSGQSQSHGFPVQHGSNGQKLSDDLLADFSTLGAINPMQQQMAGLNIHGQVPAPAPVAPNFAAMQSGFTNHFQNPPVQPPTGQTFTAHFWQ